MKCPIDNTELIKKIYEETVEVDFCNSCSGMWLDKNELEKIQEIKINDYQEELAKITDYVGHAFSMAQAKAKPEINCPVCNKTMEKREYGYCSQIMIDSCIEGHGVWLDKGEVEALEIFYEKSRFEARDIKKGFLASLRSFLNRS